ncbi:hypothetical protein Taro_025325 [Colocasia esculenta]|uniref:Uncharacterized protein n=1 Tax=Colocasia esculenta TaxID=4460 RepID=A0A843V9W7_COLES|nr:hypothetical protein [Colocasia esculenta]
MEGLIKKGELQMGEYRVNPPQPHEPPARQAAANMISLYQQLPEEISEASTQKTYENYVLTPIKENEGWHEVPKRAKNKPEVKPAPQIRGVTPQPPAPVVTPVWYETLLGIIIRGSNSRRRRTPLPLYRGGNPSLERLQALIDELDEYEQPDRYPVRLQEYVPWEELEKLSLEAPAAQETPQPQEELFWGQEATEPKKKNKRRSKKKKVVASLSCNAILSLLGLVEHHDGEEICSSSNDVNQISEPEVRGAQIPPPLGLYKNEESGGAIPSFAEFLAAKEQVEAAPTPPKAQNKANQKAVGPVVEVQVEIHANNQEKLKQDDVGAADRIIKLLKKAPTHYEACLADMQVEAAVVNTESIMFTPEDMLLPMITHNRPLYMRGQLNGLPLNRILVDAGAAVNILPYKIYQKYHFDVHLTSVHDMSGFHHLRQGLPLQNPHQQRGHLCIHVIPRSAHKCCPVDEPRGGVNGSFKN